MVRLITNEELGLKVLREAPSGDTQAIDIVAIHGIGAHPDDTWCKNVGTAENPRWVNWLTEKDMLPAVAPNARIMRYGYQLRLSMVTVAHGLLLALKRERKEYPIRPLVFIAHCFGGLVVLKALIESHYISNGLHSIFRLTTGLMFFGTPFRGAEGMSQIEILEAAWREYYDDEVQGDILKILAPGNGYLQGVVDQFSKIQSLTKKAKVACFYELKSSNVGWIIGKQDRTRFLVSESSGCLNPSDRTSNFSLSRTHFDMNKFGKPTEEEFRTVKIAIKQMISPFDKAVSFTFQYDSKENIDLSHPGLPVEIYEGQHLDIINQDVLPFRSIKHLGMGGSASVEMIQLTRNGRQFAHKVFRKVYGQRLDEAKRNFRNEIEIIRRLSPHPHIVHVFATYTCGRTLGMLLAPVADDGDLGTYLQMISDSEHPPTIEQTTILNSSFGCLANGLAFIHKHTIRHKDIKPQNILIHKGRVIYTDFGIALDASQKENTTTIGHPGAFTRRYCAPEVANWDNRNRKSDVFSLGCVFIDVLAVLEPQTGLREFEAYWHPETIDSLQNILGYRTTTQSSRDPLFRICHDMLQSKPEDRISSETLLERMSLLWGPPSDTEFNYFCDGCAPKPEQQKADPTTSLSPKQQGSSQFTGILVSSVSASRRFQPHDEKITPERLTVDPNPSVTRRRRRRGIQRNKEKMIKESWGSRENFQASYGLRMTPEDLQMGDAILQEMMRLDRLPPKAQGS